MTFAIEAQQNVMDSIKIASEMTLNEKNRSFVSPSNAGLRSEVKSARRNKNASFVETQATITNRKT